MDKTTYDSDRKLAVSLDGARVELGTMELMERRFDANIGMGDHQYFVESFEQAAPFDIFVRITSATKVTLTMGTSDLQLSNEHLEAFRDLISRVQ